MDKLNLFRIYPHYSPFLSMKPKGVSAVSMLWRRDTWTQHYISWSMQWFAAVVVCVCHTNTTVCYLYRYYHPSNEQCSSVYIHPSMISNDVHYETIDHEYNFEAFVASSKWGGALPSLPPLLACLLLCLRRVGGGHVDRVRDWGWLIGLLTCGVDCVGIVTGTDGSYTRNRVTPHGR